MATYVLPQVLVFQDFNIVPAAVANPLRSHISGPHAYLLRYADEDERAKGKLGYYDRLVETGYTWPDRPAGAEVDEGYVKLWMKDALLQYFADAVSAGSTITKTSGYNNRIRSATVNFAENGDDYPRHSSLLDRDAAPGDVVKVTAEGITLWTYIKRLIGDTVDAVIEDPSADANNEAGQSASVSVEKVSGAVNCVNVSADGDEYDGYPSGYITETYDIVVLESSVGGDFSTAKIRVISGSGTDDVAEVTPATANNPTQIGNRGLYVLFDTVNGGSCSDSADTASVSPLDLIAGQRWQVTVNQAFAVPTIASGGSYDSAQDTTYILTVTRGGKFTADILPQITVTTTNGVDLSGPTTVTASGEAVEIGTRGVTFTPTGTGLRKGDKFYVTVTGEGEGPMRTIELGNNLSTDISAGTEVSVELFIRKPLLQIVKNREGFAPLTNWETSDTEITVADGIIAYDETWTDDGVEQPLDVYSAEDKGYGELYVEYRAWRTDLSEDVYTIDDPGNLDDIPGAVHPDNPLKWGVSKALENANGTEVKYTAVANPDDAESWVHVLEKVLGRDDVYGLVPLTRDRTVLNLYAAHVKAQSSPEEGLWRVLWTALAGVPELPIVHAGSTVAGHTEATTTDGETCLCVVEDDSETSGTQYTIVRCTSDNGNFITNGVRAGDIVRLLYTGDGFGNFTYSEFVVDEVISEDELRLLTGPDAPISVAAKVEIWRNLTATEESAEIARDAGSWGDRRIRAVWPDKIESSGTVMEGYFACCSLAGLRSGVLPHQGLTKLEIVGYTDVPRSVSKFNKAQMDTMALAGTWIITQDLVTGQIFTRHAVTTGDYADINEREEMIVANVDSISFRFKDQIAPFIGVTNVTPTMERILELEVKKLVDLLRSESQLVTIGGQLISAELAQPIRPHAVFKDRYLIVLNCDVPEPFNNAEIHLVI